MTLAICAVVLLVLCLALEPPDDYDGEAGGAM